MTAPPEPYARTRQLGRSRSYTCDDVPPRVLNWHAPRANRWERLCVEAGELAVEWLDADGVRTEVLANGMARWVAPGRRWRVATIDDTTRFVLEVHADDSTAAAAPQPLRAALLDDARQVRLDAARQVSAVLDELDAGIRVLVCARFDFSALVRQAIARGEGRLCWHPLEARDGQFVALISRSPRPIDLPEYLGRDHAVIEAALAGALRDETDRMTWLRTALARHLAIEEDLLFPAYLATGGNAGWVKGLCNEHRHLRHHLDHLDDSVSRRRFLLLLDGHDEKEEQIVYPDIVLRLGGGLDGLYRQVMDLGVGDGVAKTA